MIAAWMMYATVSALLITIAAFAAEHAVRALGRQTRFVWLSALALSLALSGARLFERPEPRVSSTSMTAAAIPRALPGPPGARPIAPKTARTTPPTGNRTDHGITVTGRAAAFDRPLLMLWAAVSLGWGALLFGSGARLRRTRRRWRPELLDGTPVYVSHDVGPALFGIGRYSIVVPGWVLELPRAQRALVIAHEREHARAGDPIVLLGGALAVLVQPWNPIVWWMFRRLSFAVEADCDARVLAASRDVREYGALLIDIGARALAGAAPIAALSEPQSQLERRITRMTSRPFTRPTLRAAGSSIAAVLVVTAACQVPRPTLRPTTAIAITPEVDFIAYRWVDTTADAPTAFVDASGEALSLGDTVVVDIAGIDSAWVARTAAGGDTTASVVVRLLPNGAARMGAATATHVGRRIAVVVDGHVATVATIQSALGATIPLVTDVSRAAAESLSARVNRTVAMLRPVQPLTITRPLRAGNDSAREANTPGRAVLHITSLGLELPDGARPHIRIYGTGRARVGLGTAAPVELSDTLRLDHLPAMTVDVSAGTVYLEIDGPARMRVGGRAEGSSVQDFEARGRRIVLTRNGVHVSDA